MECIQTSDCPFMFLCNEKKSCEHEPIFPLWWYPVLIYILIPFGCGFVNVAGKSMGILKVALLMNLLRYNTSQSTPLVQPMVAGSALINVLCVLKKKHPLRNTSVIDYDIILILIPCSLLASTQGAMIQKFVPEIVQDFATILFFALFSWQFFRKAKEFHKESKQIIVAEEDLIYSQITENDVQNQNNELLKQEENVESLVLSEEQKEIKNKILSYENTAHWPDIGLSILVFIVFEFMVFVIEGKLPFFHPGTCSKEKMLGLLLLTLLTVAYIYSINSKIVKKYTLYKEIGIDFNVDLSNNKTFIKVCIGGYLAGLTQGILGVGSGTFIVGALITLGLHPQVVAATSGYQILFVGLSAFGEEFANGSILIQDATFLFLLTFIGGGIVTLLMYKTLKKYSDKKVKSFLVFSMFGLCFLNTVFMIPFVWGNISNFGWKKLWEIDFHC